MPNMSLNICKWIIDNSLILFFKIFQNLKSATYKNSQKLRKMTARYTFTQRWINRGDPTPWLGIWPSATLLLKMTLPISCTLYSWQTLNSGGSRVLVKATNITTVCRKVLEQFIVSFRQKLAIIYGLKPTLAL